MAHNHQSRVRIPTSLPVPAKCALPEKGAERRSGKVPVLPPCAGTSLGFFAPSNTLGSRHRRARMTKVTRWKRGTYNVGRNKAKREKRA